MGLTLKGDQEMAAKIERLNYGVQRDARKALRDGAEVYEKALKANTPIYNGPDADNVHLADDTTHTGVSISTGDLTVEVGYGAKTGYYAHFPNFGTSKQDPQHFIEKTNEEAKQAVLEAFLKNLKVGG